MLLVFESIFAGVWPKRHKNPTHCIIFHLLKTPEKDFGNVLQFVRVALYICISIIVILKFSPAPCVDSILKMPICELHTAFTDNSTDKLFFDMRLTMFCWKFYGNLFVVYNTI